MKSKKADGMTLNIIVVAALALIVLIVLTAIFAGKIKTSSDKGDQSTGETLSKVCASLGGYCWTGKNIGGCAVQPGGSSDGKGYIDCSGMCCTAPEPPENK